MNRMTLEEKKQVKVRTYRAPSTDPNKVINHIRRRNKLLMMRALAKLRKRNEGTE
jgi:hypothetical protein